MTVFPSLNIPITTLRAAKACREAQTHNTTPKQIAARTSIPLKRYVLLESINPHKAEEPWLDEAVRIAMVLQTEVRPLLGVASLDELDLGFDPRDDLDIWRTGVRLPLSTACRLCLRFGIDDPIHLEHLPHAGFQRQAWEIIASGERATIPGACPWCVADLRAGAPHLDTCLPTFMWGPRNAPLSTIGPVPVPRRPGKRRFGARPGRGLRRLRDSLGVTQAQFAASIEKNPSYYARIEQCAVPLGVDLAERIAALYRVDLSELYAGTEDVQKSE